jgi:hypothetical protein
MGLIHEKNQRPKISCYCTFKLVIFFKPTALNMCCKFGIIVPLQETEQKTCVPSWRSVQHCEPPAEPARVHIRRLGRGDPCLGRTAAPQRPPDTGRPRRGNYMCEHRPEVDFSRNLRFKTTLDLSCVAILLTETILGEVCFNFTFNEATTFHSS